MNLGATTVISERDYAWMPFDIPGHSGDLRAAFLNRDLSAGPIVAAMDMAAGSRIPAHVHHRTTETFFVLSGTFVNAGVSYGAGAFFTVRTGEVHGPHETPDGCRVIFMQSVEVDSTDFEIAE